MTVFVKTISDLMALFLQALRFDMLLPSLILVGLNITFVLPRLQSTPLFQRLQVTELDVSAGIIAGLTILLVAYVLNVLNGIIIRFFEGYPLLSTKIGEILRDHNQTYVETLIQSIGDQKDQILHIEESKEKAKAQAKLNEAQHQLHYMYPFLEKRRFLPTRLGNVLASAEQHPSVLYGIDSVAMWPFLVPILQKSGYMAVVASEKSLMDFLLNMSVITLFFGGELAYLELLLTPAISIQLGLTILIECLGSAFVAYLFYSLAVSGALAWGYTIRVAFATHKELLRRTLGLPAFKNITKERILWKNAGHFFRDVNPSAASILFEYPLSEKAQSELLES